MRVSDLLAALPPAPEYVSTGIPGLDDLTGGGFADGRLWVLTGAPAVGKSTLLIQFVYALAVTHRRVVDFYGSRFDDPALTRGRLLSLAVGRAPAPGSLAVPTPEGSSQAVELDALRSSRLTVSTGGGFVVEALGDSAVPGRCLAVDDPEGKRPPVLARAGRQALRAAADSGDLVRVTVPRSLCLERLPLPAVADHRLGSATVRECLREEWAAVADLVIEVGPTSAHESALWLWQNRWGPTGAVEVTYEPQRSRFVGLPLEGGSRTLSGVPGHDVEET